MPRIPCPANCNQGLTTEPVPGKPFPKYSRQVKCSTCNGKGSIEGTTPTAKPGDLSNWRGKPGHGCTAKGSCNCSCRGCSKNNHHCSSHASGCHERCN